MNSELLQSLRRYGFTDLEARIYLTLLTTGTNTASSIAKKANVNRTTTYDTLNSLQKKGVVSSIVRNKILYFEAADPSSLVQILEEKKKELEIMLPQFQKLRLPGTPKPVVELYDGKEGIKSIYQDILNEKKSLCAISNTHYIFKVLPFFVPHFINSRVKRRIHLRLLNEKTPESQRLMKAKDYQELRETRFIPELQKIPITEYIYGEKVAILKTNPEEPLGIIIQDKDYAQAQKMLFEMLWKDSK